MSNLFTANLRRLFKSKGVIISLVAMLFITLLCSMIMGSVDSEFENVYYSTLPYFVFYIAFMTSMYFGTDYSDMTIRNKIIAGHTRDDIYFANQLTGIVSSAIMFALWAVTSFICAFSYSSDVDYSTFGTKLLISFLSVLTLSVIFTAITQLITSKASSVAWALIFSILLIVTAFYFINALQEPQTTYSYITVSADGIDFGDEIPNPAYVSGKMRNVYEIAYKIIPCGQQIIITDDGDIQPLTMSICSIAVSIIFLLFGRAGFVKKDLK